MNGMSKRPRAGSALARRLFERMLTAAGPRHWWPCDRSTARDGRDEIVIGAVLTQNTAWTNVEKALVNLREAGLIDLEKLALAAPESIAPLIRPAGYFNLKSKRLAAVASFFAPGGRERYGRLDGMDGEALREAILGVYGVGPETADSILLYALGRTSFVIDAYTLRIGRRHGLFDEQTQYHEARRWFMDRLGPDEALYNEYHALLVWIGNRFCKPTPRCGSCPLMRRNCFARTEDWKRIRDGKQPKK